MLTHGGSVELDVAPPGEQPPVLEYSEDGVDLSIVRWMLSLTPAERLQALQKHINRVRAIRELNGRV
jgi:hypothetical protein